MRSAGVLLRFAGKIDTFALYFGHFAEAMFITRAN
jgi:hypothetical protein